MSARLRSRRPVAAGVTQSCSLLLATAILLLVAGSPVRARTLGEIQDRQEFSICAAPDALPFSKRAGHPLGLQIDLARIIAARLGVRLEIDWIVFRRSARRVDCDAFMSSIDRGGMARHSVLPEPVMRQALTRPYARLTTRVVTRDGAPRLQSFADLRKTVVAVPPASYLHYLLDTHHVTVRTRYMTDQEILDAVANGEVPAGVVSDWYLGWYRQTHPNARLHAESGFVLDPDLDYDVAVTLRNADQPAVLAVNRILAELMAERRMAGLFAQYGIPYRPPAAD